MTCAAGAGSSLRPRANARLAESATSTGVYAGDLALVVLTIRSTTWGAPRSRMEPSSSSGGMSISFAGPPEPRARTLGFVADAFVVHLEDGRSLTVPLEWFPRLRDATPDSGSTTRRSATASPFPGPTSTKTSPSRASSASPARVAEVVARGRWCGEAGRPRRPRRLGGALDQSARSACGAGRLSRRPWRRRAPVPREYRMTMIFCQTLRARPWSGLHLVDRRQGHRVVEVLS